MAALNPLDRVDEFRVLFARGFYVTNKDQKVIGRGLFEKHLEELNYTKSELRKMIKAGILQESIVNLDRSWRKTYYLPLTKEEFDEQEKITQQQKKNAR